MEGRRRGRRRVGTGREREGRGKEGYRGRGRGGGGGYNICIVLRVTLFLQFKIDGAWHTWIHYDKFHELVCAGACIHTSTRTHTSLDCAFT